GSPAKAIYLGKIVDLTTFPAGTYPTVDHRHGPNDFFGTIGTRVQQTEEVNLPARYDDSLRVGPDLVRSWTALSSTVAMIQRSGSANFQFVTDSASASNLYFGTEAVQAAGQIGYSHANKRFSFLTDAVLRCYLETVSGSLATLRPAANGVASLGTATQRWLESYAQTYFVGGGTVSISSGAGTPEGVVSAQPGSLYLNLAGGAATSLYVKQSGAGTNT